MNTKNNFLKSNCAEKNKTTIHIPNTIENMYFTYNRIENVQICQKKDQYDGP